MIHRLYCYFLTFGLFSVSCGYGSVSEGHNLIQAGQIAQGQALLKKYAHKGDASGAFFLGLSYLVGPNKQVKEAVRLIEYAAHKNYPPALDTLAGFYLHGDFIPKDKTMALSLYQKGAALGYGPSQFNCGIMYRNGDGCVKNNQKAYIYLSLATLNKNDLDLMTENAAQYRDEVTPSLSPLQRTEAAVFIHHFYQKHR